MYEIFGHIYCTNPGYLLNISNTMLDQYLTKAGGIVNLGPGDFVLALIEVWPDARDCYLMYDT